jgi:TPP-dependent indolepyruvate ferredoxin oxidoreductase alpha subunit
LACTSIARAVALYRTKAVPYERRVRHHRIDYTNQDLKWHRQSVVIMREGCETRLFRRPTGGAKGADPRRAPRALGNVDDDKCTGCRYSNKVARQ